MTGKLSSRKFLLVCLWNAFLLMGFVSGFITGTEVSYMGQLIGLSGAVTTSYVAIQGFADAKK